jgi:hypothetical protein
MIPLQPALHRALGIVRRRDKPARPALQALLDALEGAAVKMRSPSVRAR